jgi:carboxypeptidase D
VTRSKTVITILQNEEDLAAQLVGFMQQFLEVFKEMKGKKLYLSGESVRLIIK